MNKPRLRTKFQKLKQWGLGLVANIRLSKNLEPSTIWVILITNTLTILNHYAAWFVSGVPLAASVVADNLHCKIIIKPENSSKSNASNIHDDQLEGLTMIDHDWPMQSIHPLISRSDFGAGCSRMLIFLKGFVSDMVTISTRIKVLVSGS